ncbi:unnamed protein product [Arabidopsis thaliana]|uniref:RNase H type-1 domain-containing protein n=1 Tax=Arabidopsis thaliana TaxID=3702 RepID=A0A5S9XI63_ARATH|nr:unnamed protein product [Arabidopsis thaliana]
MDKRYMKKEGEDDPKPSRGDVNSEYSCNLYFKGFLRVETTGLLAGFEVAICREKDDSFLFQMRRSLHYSVNTVLEAELIALKRGLTEAVSLGINHIWIYCENYQVLELVMERSAPEKENIALIMNDVQRI